MHPEQYDINENDKPKSYEILREKTDKENKIVEPHKPRKKKYINCSTELTKLKNKLKNIIFAYIIKYEYICENIEFRGRRVYSR